MSIGAKLIHQSQVQLYQTSYYSQLDFFQFRWNTLIMEKSFNLKVSVRINEKCSDVIDQVSFNHLILSGKQGDHKKFQVDKIYSSNDNNEKLFQNILRIPSNIMLEGLSSVVFFLGSPNSGKTYCLAGKTIHMYEKQAEPGIIVFMMRRLFSKFKHQVSLYSTYSFWCKFLFVERDRVRNLNGELHARQWQNNETTKILIKNYSHFEQLISLVYSSNNNKCHTIIELILQKDTPNQQPTTASVTFVQFGSFFYNCPFREAEELSMENDIEATLLTIKNLSKAKEIGTNIFDSSLLTKLLKPNFLKSCSFQFVGMLDDSYQNNLKTLNFLDIIMHKKQTYAYSKNVKEEIKRQQLFLKGLYDKHRRVLNLLSRCIGMELGYLDKKKKRNFDGPVLNTFYKTCQKIKYANQKKLQNEKQLEEIKKDIDKQKLELSQIQVEYDQKFKKLDQQKQLLLSKRDELNALYDSVVNPYIKFSHADNSLYSKLEGFEEKSYKKFISQEQQLTPNNPVDSERQSKNDGKSFRILSASSPQITTRKNIISKYEQNNVKHQGKYERETDEQINQLGKRRIIQMKLQISQIFKMILAQEQQIEKQKDKIPLHSHSLLNKIKNRNSGLNPNILLEARNCYMELASVTQIPYEYQGMLENLKIHQKVDKDLMAINNANSMGVISMKSLRSDKQFRIV